MPPSYYALEVEKVEDCAIAIVIPTVDRQEKLNNLLHDIQSQTLKPSQIIVIDSSAIPLKNEYTNLNLNVIAGSKRSAARQRNQGLESLVNSGVAVDFVAFVDDDVSLPSDYLRSLIEHLIALNAAGVSGIAIGSREKFIPNTVLFRKLGLSGPPGKLTAAAINVPVREVDKISPADWLIGCSIWRFDVIKDLRFQNDFMGASIFEDVLFSVEASRRGLLFVVPSVKIEHHLESEGRPNSESFFEQWTRNRYRLKFIAPDKFDSRKYWLVNLCFLLKKLVIDRNFRSARGIIRGSKEVLLNR